MGFYAILFGLFAVFIGKNKTIVGLNSVLGIFGVVSEYSNLSN